MSKVELAETLFDTWDISGDEFPKAGPPSEKLRFLLKYAVLAPSSHNTQPWLFRIEGDHVDLYADRSRALPVVDPEDRELVISCGAAFFHLCIALRHFGYEDEVKILPDPNNPDLLARVRLGNAWETSPEEHELFYAASKRRTNRMPFFDRKVPVTVLAKLQAAALKQKSCLYIVWEGGERNALAAMISESDRLQWSDRRFRRELAAWIHPNRAMSHDGIPGYAMGFGDLMSIAGPVVARTFDLGNGRAARDEELVSGSPVLAVLGTPGDTPRDWFAVGEALARVLLRAAVDGVSASFLNQPIEVPDLRALVQDIVGNEDYPQLILRMGYGPEVMLTPRRPVREVVI